MNDSTQDTLGHIGKVQARLQTVCNNLSDQLAAILANTVKELGW